MWARAGRVRAIAVSISAKWKSLSDVHIEVLDRYRASSDPHAQLGVVGSERGEKHSRTIRCIVKKGVFKPNKDGSVR
ncbi:unnamed protein product [Acidithrix sp. C25]|nr:unnamed protein product [Acidithrix sp. C25]